jgi:hypothetical protein
VEKAAHSQIWSGSTDKPEQPVAWKKSDPLFRCIKMGTGCHSHVPGWKGKFQLVLSRNSWFHYIRIRPFQMFNPVQCMGRSVILRQA